MDSKIDGLNDIAAADVVSALLAQVVDGSVTINAAFIALIAWLNGKVTVDGNDYSFKKQDGVTELFKWTVVESQRTVS